MSLPAFASPEIHIDRSARTLTVIGEDGAILHTAPVGIGRGGLGEKASMSDLITPTGRFEVDLVLTGQGGVVAPAAVERFAGDAEFAALLADLPALFANMNRIDFDGNGAPDVAYGSAYIGLTSAEAVTGPKMRRYRDGTAYWFSIALHGTPDPANIGAANSGGCVHVDAAVLQALLADDAVGLGTVVVIQ